MKEIIEENEEIIEENEERATLQAIKTWILKNLFIYFETSLALNLWISRS